MSKAKRGYPSVVLETGAAILTAARQVDTTKIKPRLDAFAEAHRRYLEAQRKVDAIEAQIGACQEALDVENGRAIEPLARALVTDGAARSNPFAAFGADSPSAIKNLPLAEQAKAIRSLAASVQRHDAVSPAAVKAARTAEQAAEKMVAALDNVTTLQGKLQQARHARDVIHHSWRSALNALKRGARAAADEGAPELYNALFGNLPRSTTKKKAKPQQAPAPPAAAPVSPPVASNPA